MRAEAYLKAWRQEVAAAGRYEIADRTESRLAALLGAMREWGWELLRDRRWPGTRSANIDMVAVGPGGVLVIDVKAWAEPSVRDGRLLRGDAPADDQVDAVLRMTAAVEEAVAGQGLVPLHVVPVIVLAGRDDGASRVGRLVVVGELQVVLWAARLPPRVGADDVRRLSDALARALPPYDDPVPASVPLPRVEPVPPRAGDRPGEAGDQQELLSVDALEQALLDAALAGTAEEWMTFLHPAQVALVRRNWTGPARIRGPAGTGKTVVALHRVAYLAAARPGRILVTAYVRTLPDVLGGVYRRLAPEHAGRVDFLGLHRLAVQLLRQRDLPHRTLTGQVERVWEEAWTRVGARGCLPDLVPDPRYWRQEIDSVIKGRGLREFPEYAGVERPGRRTRLRDDHRAAVWDLYAAYQNRLTDLQLLDFNDVLAAALHEVRREPLEPAYQAVVVDEVNDLNLLGLRLVRALAPADGDGLLLVGDGRQAVYPGGVRLRDAGIDVTGRAAVLRVNYRNTAEILAAATALVPSVASGDPDDPSDDGAATAVRHGPVVVETRCADQYALDRALVHALSASARRGSGHAGSAVLCRHKREVRHYQDLLRRHGVPVQLLEDYAGLEADAVKLGTYKRAKGLDFPAVFLPAARRVVTAQAGPAELERAELDDRELHVAATRARDELWIGRLTGRHA